MREFFNDLETDVEFIIKLNAEWYIVYWIPNKEYALAHKCAVELQLYYPWFLTSLSKGCCSNHIHWREACKFPEELDKYSDFIKIQKIC